MALMKANKRGFSLRKLVSNIEEKIPFTKSIWFFPFILALVMIGLTAFKLSGTSIGVYHQIFYGAQPDSSLVFNKPQDIRSDEWVVNTQMTIAEKYSGYQRVNPNIGHGEDVSLIVDVPYKEWTTIFKPHNLAFFVLPFEFAFALKWWLMAYLLVISCYFFILALLPKQRWLAIWLSLALLFAPFIQWWYQYITVGPIYYTFFILTALIHLLKQVDRKKALAWGALTAYLITCFVLVLYPPFQIACGLALLIFFIGYVLQRWPQDRQQIIKNLWVVAGSVVVAGALVGGFLYGRSDVIRTIENTAYPGERFQQSGGFNVPHVFSGQLGFEYQSVTKANLYQIPQNGLTNQSENSNFILLLPFLFLPSIWILLQDKKAKRATDWPLLFVNGAFLGAMAWMFIPHLDFIGKITLLDRVPHVRLLIGLGVLSFMQVVLLIRRLQQTDFKPSKKTVALYSLAVLTVVFGLSMYAMYKFPGFIRWRGVIVSVIPLPVVIYLLLRKKFAWSAFMYCLFSLSMVIAIHPLYRGTQILTETPISKTIRNIAQKDPSAYWAVEYGPMENFAYMNGAKSLSGVYFYPQLPTWQSADPDRKNEAIYNRYAHTNFVFDRDVQKNIKTQFLQPTADHFGLLTEPCGDFVQKNHIRYILTDTKMSDSCTRLIKEVRYPAHTFFVYQVTIP